MKQVSDIEQTHELGRLKNFPEPDMVIEYFWAVKNHPFHLMRDKNLLIKDEDVDYVPAWSLGKMIEGLPGSIEYCEKSCDDDIPITYDLHICPESDGKMAQVKYVMIEGTKVLYKTESVNLADALFEMIMKLDNLGWYK